jgi:putative transposase
MPQSLANALIHIVFSTQERSTWFKDLAQREEMFAYLGGISAKLDCPTLVVGGHVDHVHILARQARTISLAEWVKELKRASNIWAKRHFAGWGDFQWQAGYGAFSVSQSMSDKVVAYIREQEEHHKTLTFQDEYRELLRRHGVEWDERYVWD